MVKSIKDWADWYRKEQDISYDELIERALHFYKKYNGSLELLNLVSSREFRQVIKKTHKLVVRDENDYFLKKITNLEAKQRYLSSFKDISTNYLGIISEQNVEIVIINNSTETIAFAIVSYQNRATPSGNYAFLHLFKIIRKEFKKDYENLEKMLRNYIKGNGYSYYYRLLGSEVSDNSFEELSIIYNVRLLLDKNINSVLQYSIEESEVDYESYVIEAKRGPEQFCTPKAIGVTRKFTAPIGSTFFIHYIVKNNGALVTVIVEKGIKDNLDYLHKVFAAAMDFLKTQEIEDVYLTISERGYFILEKLGHMEVLSSEKWVRKKL